MEENFFAIKLLPEIKIINLTRLLKSSFRFNKVLVETRIFLLNLKSLRNLLLHTLLYSIGSRKGERFLSCKARFMYTIWPWSILWVQSSRPQAIFQIFTSLIVVFLLLFIINGASFKCYSIRGQMTYRKSTSDEVN